MTDVIFRYLFFVFFSTLSFAYSQDSLLLRQVDSMLMSSHTSAAESLLRTLPDTVSTYHRINYYQAVIHLQRNDYEAAITYLKNAIQKDPENPDYHFMIGNAYAMKMADVSLFSAYWSTKNMLKSFERVLELNPGHLEARLFLYQYYLNTPRLLGGNAEKAAYLAQNVIKTHPSLGHYLLALYWEEQGNDAETERELQRSLESDSTNVGTLNHLGYYYIRQREPEKSYPFFKKAIQAAPNTANVYDSMGDYFAATARYDSALHYYNRALSRDPGFTVSIYNKAKMLEVLGRTDEALDVYRSLSESFPEDFYGKKAKIRAGELD